jgi:hypothetical protein
MILFTSQSMKMEMLSFIIAITTFNYHKSPRNRQVPVKLLISLIKFALNQKIQRNKKNKV